MGNLLVTLYPPCCPRLFSKKKYTKKRDSKEFTAEYKKDGDGQVTLTENNNEDSRSIASTGTGYMPCIDKVDGVSLCEAAVEDSRQMREEFKQSQSQLSEQISRNDQVAKTAAVVEIAQTGDDFIQPEVTEKVRSLRPNEGEEDAIRPEVAEEVKSSMDDEMMKAGGYIVSAAMSYLTAAEAVAPEEKDAFREAYDGVADADGEVDAYQLREALNNTFQHDFEFSGFSIDMCRSLVASRDEDISGQLGYAECEEMWTDILVWRNSFQELDADRNGYIEAEQMNDVLSQFGVNLKPRTVEALIRRYSNKQGHVLFEDFVCCMIKLKSMLEVYQDQKNQSTGRKALFAMDEFIQMTVYC